MTDPVESAGPPAAPPADGDGDGELEPGRAGWRTWYVVSLLGAFVAVCLGPSLLGFRTLISTNLLSGFYPFEARAGLIIAGHEVCTGDTIDAAMSGVGHMRADLAAGHLAWWQNVVAGGGPLLSVPDLGLFDPLSLPYWILPLWLAPAFVVLLSFLAGVAGCFLLLRRLGTSRPAALLAGFIFSTSGFMVMWTNWPQTRVAALIPLLFWSLERLLQRLKVVDLVLVAVVFASMLLGGFPAVTGWAIYLAIPYVIVRVAMLRGGAVGAWVRTAALSAAGLLAGLCLSAVQLLPFLHQYQTQNLAYRSNLGSAGLPLEGLLTLFAPNAYGLCINGGASYGPGGAIEMVAYVGAAALLLGIVGACFATGRTPNRARGVAVLMAVATVVMLAIAYGTPSIRHYSMRLPIFSNNIAGRMRSLVGFTVAVLAGLGFEWAITRRKRRPRSPSAAAAVRRWAWPVVVVGFVGVMALDIASTAWRNATAGVFLSELKYAMWIPMVLVIVAGVVLAWVLWWPRKGRLVAMIVLPLLVVGQGAQFFHTVLPGDDPAGFYPMTPTHAWLATHLGPDRYASSGETMYPATSLYYGLRTPTGHFFFATGWEDLLLAVDPLVMKSPTFADFNPPTVDAQTAGQQPILDQMGVRYFVAPPNRLAGTYVRPPLANGVAKVTASAPGTCTLASQPLRGVTVWIPQGVVSANLNRGMTIHLVVTVGSTRLVGAYFHLQTLPAGLPLSIPLAGESIPTGQQAKVSVWATGTAGPLVVGTTNSTMSCAPVLPSADHLRLVYSNSGSIIYQRLTALPRVRWASASLVVPNGQVRLALLRHGINANTVLLDRPAPTAAGGTGQVRLLQDVDGHLRIATSATSAGYVVVADSLQQKGWTATVDGKSAPLVPVDQAFGAVFTPAGQHTVALTYAAPGLKTGAAISLLAAMGLLGIVGWTLLKRRRSAAVPTDEGAESGQAEVDQDEADSDDDHDAEGLPGLHEDREHQDQDDVTDPGSGGSGQEQDASADGEGHGPGAEQVGAEPPVRDGVGQDADLHPEAGPADEAPR